MLTTTLVPEEHGIAPPAGVSQAESFAWRKPKPCRSVRPKYGCYLDRKSCEEGWSMEAGDAAKSTDVQKRKKTHDKMD